MGLIYGITRQLYMKNDSYQSPANNGSVGVGLIGGREMSLHDRIMELPTQDRHLEDWSNTRMAWLAGFDTGLHEAAQIAKEADELMAEMVEFLQSCNFDNNTDMREAVALVKKYKESDK